MGKLRTLLIAAIACAVPAAAGATGLSAPNNVPGGITLVPGTVVTPGISGSVVTGTVPLAGTVGSPGVGSLNPNLAPSAAGDSGGLYPTLQPQFGFPGANQSTLPQSFSLVPSATNPQSGLQNIVPPSGAICPAGVSRNDGSC